MALSINEANFWCNNKHTKVYKDSFASSFFLTITINFTKMGLFDQFSKQHEEVHETPSEHKGHLSHELIAGAASYEAVKAYQKHCEENGKPSDHGTAKALLAGFAGAALDKLIETKGLDFIDKQKAKRDAESGVTNYYENEH